MEKDQGRFDVSYDRNGANIDYHFCREVYEDGNGCFGTDPKHGLSFKQAKEEVKQFYLGMVKIWEEMTYEEWSNPSQDKIE